MTTETTTILKQAKQVLSEYWPLNAFIASNPLWQLRQQNFYQVISQPRLTSVMNLNYYQMQYRNGNIADSALSQALKLHQQHSTTIDTAKQWLEQSTSHTTTSNLLFAEQQAEYQFQKPNVWIKERVFTTLRDYFGLKHYQHSNLSSYWLKHNSNLKEPTNTKHANEQRITQLLNQLGVTQDLQTEYLQAIYLQCYGWSSFLNWREQHADNPWAPGADACENILIMWLSYECLIANELQKSHQQPANTDNAEQLQQRCIWQTAFELHYAQQLDTLLDSNPGEENHKPDAQFIFCIDTRSEGLRRHLEAQGNFQTFGFGGFFGAAFKLHKDHDTTYQAPGLVNATETVCAHSSNNKQERFSKRLASIISNAKEQLTAPFALFEMLGFWMSLFMLFKTLQPGYGKPRHAEKLSISKNLSEAAQYDAAYNLLNTIGLTKHFASHVFICGHQSDNTNNPFKSSLDCGACGGNSGVANATLMCNILNNNSIREKLANAGITIPANTQFVDACHHTTNDRLEALHQNMPDTIQQAVRRACTALKQEKLQSLPNHNKLAKRELDWSELIPELGLINNAAIVIGPRQITAKADLGRRVFLHSYAPERDNDAAVLTSILSAPAIVAHWINAQYYFSTSNPKQFGAGNKAIHNVLPGVGVLEGNLSDLKVGLPLQSTHFQAQPIHEPRRLIVVVYAKPHILEQAINDSPEFKTLLDNQWIHLKHIEAN